MTNAQWSSGYEYIISNFFCWFLNPNYFFSNLNSNWSNALASEKQVKKTIRFKNWTDLSLFEKNIIHIDLEFFCKILIFSLKCQKFFFITGTIFSYSKSEQFSKQKPNLHLHNSCFFMQFYHFFYKLKLYVGIQPSQNSTLKLCFWHL